MIDFDKFRRNDSTIDLVYAFMEEPEREYMEHDQTVYAINFLEDVERRKKIVSRQLAALALTTAIALANNVK